MNKKIKPSAKIHRRYLLLEAPSKEVVERTISDYIGILGYSEASPLFVNTKTKKLILSINRKEIVKVRAAFEISKEKITVLKVSGTLKGLEK